MTESTAGRRLAAFVQAVIVVLFVLSVPLALSGAAVAGFQSASHFSRMDSVTYWVSNSNDTDTGSLTVTESEGNTVTAYEFDANATSGSIRWQGQVLYFQSDGTNETYALREADAVTDGRTPGDLETQLTTDTNGVVVFDTSGLEGYYVITDENGDVVETNASGVQAAIHSASNASAVADASFEIAVQSLSASFANGSVNRGSTVDLDVNSNRGSFTVEITSGGLNSTQLHDIFGGTETASGTSIVVSGNAHTLPGNFTGISTGSYPITLSATDTDANASASIDVTEHENASASFSPSNTFSVSRGDITELTIEVRNMSRGSLFVGSQDVNYLTKVSFEDGDGDGRVTLSMNTYLAGSHTSGAPPESAAWSISSGDAITDVKRSTGPLPKPLAPGSYEMNITTIDSTQLAVGDLRIPSRTTDSVTVLTNPSSQFGDPLADLDLTSRDTVALDDNIVVRVNATGIFGLLAAQSGSSTIERFHTLVDSANASFNLTQTEASTIATSEPKELDRDASFGNGAFKVITDEANGSLYIVMDESNLRFHSGREATASGGDAFTANFTLAPASGLTSQSETVMDTVEAVDRTVTWDTAATGLVHVESAPNQTVSGETSVAPGTSLTLQLESSGENPPTPFFFSPSVTVQDDGNFSTHQDFSSVEPGTNFSASVNGFTTTAVGVVEQGATSTANTPTVITVESPGFGFLVTVLALLAVLLILRRQH